MFTFLASIFTGIGSNIFVKLFKGAADSILEYYESKDTQETLRQGTWAHALVNAAKADVENRKVAAAERAGSPLMMTLYFLVVFPPIMYYGLFWADTIFQFSWDLPRAPSRLEEFGQSILTIFIGGGTAVAGVVKGAKILSNAGIFRK